MGKNMTVREMIENLGEYSVDDIDRYVIAREDGGGEVDYTNGNLDTECTSNWIGGKDDVDTYYI